MEKYSPKERTKFADLFALIVDGLETDPEQDFLGELFMGLGLGNHWKGAILYPVHLCRMNAALLMDGIEEAAEKDGWGSVLDPACGAGAQC